MEFCNVNFNVKNRDDLFNRSIDVKTKLIIPANAALIVEANNSSRFLNLLNTNHVTFDGRIPFLTAKCVYYFRGLFSGRTVKG